MKKFTYYAEQKLPDSTTQVLLFASPKERNEFVKKTKTAAAVHNKDARRSIELGSVVVDKRGANKPAPSLHKTNGADPEPVVETPQVPMVVNKVKPKPAQSSIVVSADNYATAKALRKMFVEEGVAYEHEGDTVALMLHESNTWHVVIYTHDPFRVVNVLHDLEAL